MSKDSDRKDDCLVYKGRKEPDTYLYVDRKDDCSKVPEELLNMMGELELVMELELVQGRKLARTEADMVLKHIEEQGYYLQLPPKYSISGSTPPH